MGDRQDAGGGPASMGWPASDGEMAALIRAHDWASTPLGPIGRWPQSLRTTVELMLAMPGPASLIWGPAHVVLYNDAYIEIAAARHPAMLGSPVQETWPMDHAAFSRDTARKGRVTHIVEPCLLLPAQNGRLEERAFDSSWSPIQDGSGAVEGALQILGEVTDRHRAQAALRESETRYRLLVESVAQAVWEADADGVIVTDSPGWRAYTGQTREEWIGYCWLDAIHPDDRPYAERQWRTAIAARDFVNAEFRLRAPNGGWRWTNVRAAPVLDAQGRIAKWVGMNMNVDARRRAEAAMRSREEEQAFDLHLSDALASLSDPAQIRAEATRRLADHLHAVWCRFEELDDRDTHAIAPGDLHRDALSPMTGIDDLTRERACLNLMRSGTVMDVPDLAGSTLFGAQAKAACAASGMRAVLGVPLLRGGSAAAMLLVADTRIRTWTQGEVALLQGAAERICAALQRTRTEDALRMSEALLRQFGEASSDVLWIRDARTLTWEYLSPAFEAIYGVSCEKALVGDNFRSWAELIIDEDRDGAVANIGRVRQGEALTFEYRVRRPVDGQIRWLRNNDFPMYGADGRVERIGGVGQDVTELKRIEAALHAQEERLRTLMEGIPQLVWRSCDAGEWTWSSPQWQAFTGQSQAESHALGWLGVVHPDDRDAAVRAWEMAGPQSMLDAEYRVRRVSDGAYLWHHTRSVPVRDEDGRIVEWLGTTTEVQELKELQERQAVLVAELQHRTRNLMGVVRSVADKTARSSTDLSDFRTRFRDRLESLARVQGLLSRLDDVDRVAFDDLIRTELSAMNGGVARVTLTGPAGIRLRSSTVQTLAMALHELATNAMKYGALGQVGGHLAVTWSLDPAGDLGRPWLHVDWRESGVTLPPAGSKGQRIGQGRELIEHALPYQLGARTSYALEADGVHCTISIPVSDRTDVPGHA